MLKVLEHADAVDRRSAGAELRKRSDSQLAPVKAEHARCTLDARAPSWGAHTSAGDNHGLVARRVAGAIPRQSKKRHGCACTTAWRRAAARRARGVCYICGAPRKMGPKPEGGPDTTERMHSVGDPCECGRGIRVGNSLGVSSGARNWSTGWGPKSQAVPLGYLLRNRRLRLGLGRSAALRARFPRGSRLGGAGTPRSASEKVAPVAPLIVATRALRAECPHNHRFRTSRPPKRRPPGCPPAETARS